LNIIVSHEKSNKNLEIEGKTKITFLETKNSPMLKQIRNEGRKLKFCLTLNFDNILFSARMTLEDFPTSKWCHIFSGLRPRTLALMKILVSLESTQ